MSMTPAQILAAVQASYPTLTAATRAAVGDPTIAATISAGQTQLVSTRIGVGDVLEVLGPVAGAEVLGALANIAAASNTSPVYWAMQMLAQSTLDISLASTQAQLASLVTGGILTAAQQASLLALCTVAAPISVDQVSNVLNTAGY